MNHLQKSRVTVDFFAHERDVLQELCEQDIRPAQDQLRWLVLNEAKRRGLQSPAAASFPPTTKVDGIPFGRVISMGDEMRSIFLDRLTDAMLTGNESATTSTTDTETTPLTAAVMLEAIRQIRESMPVVFYVTSDHVNGTCVAINAQARCGFDIICRPCDVESLKIAAKGYILCPMTDAEMHRRTNDMNRNFLKEMGAQEPTQPSLF